MEKISLLLAMTFWYATAVFSQNSDSQATEVWEPEPKMVTPGLHVLEAPSDALVLFDGKDLSQWLDATQQPAAWTVENGVMTIDGGKGNIHTKEAFGNCQLHIEWCTPKEVAGSGQARGNSGVFLMGLYEVQVLDSYMNRTYSNGQAGSIYKQYIPLVNACRPPGEWQSFDIIFTAPTFDGERNVASPARMTVFQNGVLIHQNVELKGNTVNSGRQYYEKHGDKEPLMLQDHASPVSYRNIWIREW